MIYVLTIIIHPLHRKLVSPSLKIIIRRRQNKCCLWIRIWWLLHFLCLWVLFGEALGMADFIRSHSLRRNYENLSSYKKWKKKIILFMSWLFPKNINDKHCIQKLLYLLKLHNGFFKKIFKITLTSVHFAVHVAF